MISTVYSRRKLAEARRLQTELQEICLHLGKEYEENQCRYDHRSERWKRSYHGRCCARKLISSRRALADLEGL